MSAMPIDLENENYIDGARIKVVGVGGGGNNAVDRMIEAGVEKAEFICVNTDAQQLANVKAPTVIQLGSRITNGLGAGANPEIGRQAAEETKEEIKNLLQNTEMVFITAGMGGGTGTGAAPIIAEVSKSMGILTVAVVTKPFFFEGPQRMRNAEEGIKSLADKVDAIVTIPNDLLFKIADKKVTINDSFKLADDVLRQGVQSISDIITGNGFINLDFADVKAIMKDSGHAHMGIGVARGDNRAAEAAQLAIKSPILETSIDGAKGVLLNISGAGLGILEVRQAAELIQQYVDPSANIIFGATIDESLGEDISITVIATGFETRGSNPFGGMTKEPAKAEEPSFRPGTLFDQLKAERAQQSASYDNAPQSAPAAEDNDLDIPSFLRRRK